MRVGKTHAARRRGAGGIGLRGAALLALVALCYLPSLGGGFLWDDQEHVASNPRLLDLHGLVVTWTSPFANLQYYPLTHTSFWVEHQLWGDWPTGYRITNLLLHAVAALLLWTLLERLGVPGAAVAAAVFAVHPIQVESVAWISERKNLLSGALYLGAALAYVRFAGLDRSEADGSARSRGAYLLSLVLFFAAVLSKTAALTLPLMLWILLVWKKGRPGRAELLATLPMLLVGAGLGGVTAWLERHLGALGPEWDASLAERLLVAGRALWFYAAKVLVPFGFNFIYPRWTIDASAPASYLYPLAAVALPISLWALRSRIGRGPAAAAAFFGVTLAPSIGLVGFYFQLYSFVQDHHAYLACAGPIALVVALATLGSGRFPSVVRLGVASTVVLALGGLTLQRSQVFRSEEALWSSVLAGNPQAWMAHINLGDLLEKQGRLDEAVEHYRRAADADLRPARGHAGCAERLARLGRIDEAEARIRQGLALEPGYGPAYVTLGSILAQRGRHLEAIASYRTALALEPDRAETQHNLGLSFEALSRLGDAESAYRAAIDLDPRLAAPHNNLAIVLYTTGRYEEAWSEVRRFQELGGVPHPGFLDALSRVAPRADR